MSVYLVTRTPLSRSKGQRSRSPGRFTHRGVNASRSCNGERGNVLAAGTYCYVAVCRLGGARRFGFHWSVYQIILLGENKLPRVALVSAADGIRTRDRKSGSPTTETWETDRQNASRIRQLVPSTATPRREAVRTPRQRASGSEAHFVCRIRYKSQ